MTPQELHAAVWRVRAEIGHVWLTPTPHECLQYAFTAAGEAMDAWLRAQRPGDARNNERSPDVLDELGDCAIMLCSALPSDYTIITPDRPRPQPATLDDIAYQIGKALHRRSDTWKELALHYVYAYPNFTTTITLLRLDRIRVKYATETERVTFENMPPELGLSSVPLDWLIDMGYLTYFSTDTHEADIKAGWREALALYARRQGELSDGL